MLQVHDFNPRSREGSDTIWSDIVSRTGISIRAPARGATTERSYLLDMDVISIRAPARGATRAISPGQLYCKHFNPRSREGSDAALPPAFPLPCEFQSALPRGERHLQRNIIIPTKNFNPRSREGSDSISGRCECMDRISIRAPARGATGHILRDP